jgi:glycosyltransferase involved in cell wall biosynthesis
MSDSFNPLISVVIPTYNHAPFLQKALLSVVNQTYSNVEVLVINNFSTDETEAVVSSFANPKITLHNFHNHGIIAASRNVGIKQATGKFVAFLDSDDIWYPEKLADCVADLASGSDVVCHGELWVTNNHSSRKVMYGPEKNATYSKLLHRGNCISTSTVVAQKTILNQIGGFSEREDFVTAEDYDCWMRIAAVTERIIFIPKVLGEYHRHDGNASNAVTKNYAAEIAVIASHFNRKHPTILRAVRWRHRRARAAYAAARGLQRNRSYIASFNMYLKAIFTSPFVLRTYVGLILLCAAAFRSLLERASH